MQQKLEEKAWAKKLLVKAEKFAKDYYDFKELGSCISSGDVLGEWIQEEDDNSMYEGVSISKKDKDWSRKLFKEAQKILIDNDILLIADEVMTGFGRVGEDFASNLYKLKPDIMVEEWLELVQLLRLGTGEEI